MINLSKESKKKEEQEVKKCHKDEKENKKCKKDTLIETLTKENELLKTSLVEANDKAVRFQAEMMNFKKRKEDEVSLRLRYCNEDILLKIVEICDNFERAIKLDDDNLDDELSKFLAGFKIIYTNLVEILRANDVKEIDCLGKEFDPKVCEALIVEHVDNKGHNEVVEVLQKGYMYKDKILRPAMVKIND